VFSGPLLFGSKIASTGKQELLCAGGCDAKVSSSFNSINQERVKEHGTAVPIRWKWLR